MKVAAIKPKLDKDLRDFIQKENIDNKNIYVGDFLRDKRKEHGLKAQEVADFLGVALYTYKGYEAATNATYYRLPSLSILINLSRLYNVTLDAMLGLESEREFIEYKESRPTRRQLLEKQAQ